MDSLPARLEIFWVLFTVGVEDCPLYQLTPNEVEDCATPDCKINAGENGENSWENVTPGIKNHNTRQAFATRKGLK